MRVLCHSLALVALVAPVTAARANDPHAHGHAPAAAHAAIEASHAHAPGTTTSSAAHDAIPDDGPMLTVVVLDTSRLMQVRDPERLAPAAAQLVASLQRPGDRLALIGFAETATVVLPPTAAGDDLEARVHAALSTTPYAGRATSVGEGLRRAARVFLDAAQPAELRRVLLVTSGGEDPVEGRRAAWDVEQVRTRELVPDQLRSLGASVHSIAFTRAADAELLEAIAARSGGTYHLVASPGGLAPALVDAVADRGARLMLPFDADGGRFVIDDAIDELRVVFDRSVGTPTLVSPSGHIDTAEAPSPQAQWGGTATHGWVRLAHPASGTWRLIQAPGALLPTLFVRERARDDSPRLRIAERVPTVDHRPRLVVSTLGVGPQTASGIVIITDPHGRRSQLTLERRGAFELYLDLPLARPGRHHLDVQVRLDGRARVLAGQLDVGPSCLDDDARSVLGRLEIAARTSTGCAGARIVSIEAVERGTGERFPLVEDPRDHGYALALLSPSGPARVMTLEATLEVDGESLRVARGPYTLEALGRAPAQPWYLALLHRLGLINAPLALVALVWAVRARRAARRARP